MTEPRLALVGVGFAYGRRAVLNRIDLEVRAGDRLAILGPNGAGKSTLLRLLSGTLAPQEGRALLDGSDLSSIRAAERARRIALVAQESHVAFDFSVLEIVLMGRSPRLGWLGIEGPHDIEQARRALTLTGALHLAERPISRLSSGERQRVLLARALAQEPDTMLLDEPTAFLDLGHQVRVHRLLESLNREQGLTLVFVSHDLNLAARYADRLVLLARGKIAAEGTPSAVLTEETIREAYGVEVKVLPGRDVPGPTVLVLGPSGPANPDEASHR